LAEIREEKRVANIEMGEGRNFGSEQMKTGEEKSVASVPWGGICYPRGEEGGEGISDISATSRTNRRKKKRRGFAAKEIGGGGKNN